MKQTLISILLLMPLLAQAQYKSEVWSPDNGDGTFTNPVINADYSDPDVCAVGEDYYLTASSFQCIPGSIRAMRSWSSISAPLSMVLASGRRASVITMENTISIGAIPTMA